MVPGIGVECVCLSGAMLAKAGSEADQPQVGAHCGYLPVGGTWERPCGLHGRYAETDNVAFFLYRRKWIVWNVVHGKSRSRSTHTTSTKFNLPFVVLIINIYIKNQH